MIVGAIERRLLLLGQRERRRRVDVAEVVMIGRRCRIGAGIDAGRKRRIADFRSADAGRRAGKRRRDDVSGVRHWGVHDRGQRRVHGAGGRDGAVVRAGVVVAIVAVVVDVIVDVAVGGVDDVVEKIDVADESAVDHAVRKNVMRRRRLTLIIVVLVWVVAEVVSVVVVVVVAVVAVVVAMRVIGMLGDRVMVTHQVVVAVLVVVVVVVDVVVVVV